MSSPSKSRAVVNTSESPSNSILDSPKLDAACEYSSIRQIHPKVPEHPGSPQVLKSARNNNDDSNDNINSSSDENVVSTDPNLDSTIMTIESSLEISDDDPTTTEYNRLNINCLEPHQLYYDSDETGVQEIIDIPVQENIPSGIIHVTSLHEGTIPTGSSPRSIIHTSSIHGSSTLEGSIHFDSVHEYSLQDAHRADSSQSSFNEDSIHAIQIAVQHTSQSSSFVVDSTNISESSNDMDVRSTDVDLSVKVAVPKSVTGSRNADTIVATKSLSKLTDEALMTTTTTCNSSQEFQMELCDMIHMEKEAAMDEEMKAVCTEMLASVHADNTPVVCSEVQPISNAMIHPIVNTRSIQDHPPVTTTIDRPSYYSATWQSSGSVSPGRVTLSPGTLHRSTTGDNSPIFNTRSIQDHPPVTTTIDRPSYYSATWQSSGSVSPGRVTLSPGTLHRSTTGDNSPIVNTRSIQGHPPVTTTIDRPSYQSATSQSSGAVSPGRVALSTGTLHRSTTGMTGTSGVISPGTTRSGGYDTTMAYEESRRHLSSVIISEELINPYPATDGVTYVEVPIVENVIRKIPKRQIVELPKIVPKYEVEYVERLVETPQVKYVDRVVEKPIPHEVIVSVPVVQVQEVPREVIKHVPKIVMEIKESQVNVPGQVIEVPKPYIVENKVGVKRWIDKKVPIVVAQTIRPVVVESSEKVDVDVYEYEPQVVEVDVHVAKPISSHLSALGRLDEHHQVVTVPASQYNTILRSMNSHLVGDVNALPYIKDGIHIPFLGKEETPGTGVPIPHAQIMGYGGATISRKVTTDDAISQHHISTTRALASIHETARSIHDGSLINAGGSIIHQTTASITHGSMKLHGNSQSVVEGSKANKSVARSIHTATESFGPSHAVEKKKRACAC